MTRLLVVTAAALALTGAGPAWAHEEISPATVPTGKPVFFTLNAANEKKVDLTKVTLTAPQGLDFGAATKEPGGWTVNKSATVITWTGGAVKPDHFETWGFEIEGADQPGSPTYKVTLGYSDGTTDDVQAGITVVAATGAGSSGSTTGDGDGDGEGRATTAILLAILALVAAVGAIVVARRGSRPVTAPAGEKQDW